MLEWEGDGMTRSYDKDSKMGIISSWKTFTSSSHFSTLWQRQCRRDKTRIYVFKSRSDGSGQINSVSQCYPNNVKNNYLRHLHSQVNHMRSRQGGLRQLCARALLLPPELRRLNGLFYSICHVLCQQHQHKITHTVVSSFMASSNQINFDARAGTFNDVRGDQFNISLFHDPGTEWCCSCIFILNTRR
jgi:hypothetical protein